MLDELTVGTLACAVGAVGAWMVGLVLLGVGAWRRVGGGRIAFALAAAVQLVAAPLVVAIAWWRMETFARMFGAEAVTFAWLAQLAPATLAAALAFTVIDGLVALSPTADAKASRPASPSQGA